MRRLLVEHKRRCGLLVRALGICSQVVSLSRSSGLHEHTQTLTYTSTCVTRAHAKGLVPCRPMPTQQAGNCEAMPGPAYRDLATALHSLAWSNIHTWPPLPSAGPSGWPLICSRDNNCVNCGFSCRETVRDWLCRSVLMWADVKRSSQCKCFV